MKHHIQDMLHVFVRPIHTLEHVFLKRKEKQKVTTYIVILFAFTLMGNLVDAFRTMGGFNVLGYNALITLAMMLVFIFSLKLLGGLFTGKASYNDIATVVAVSTLFMFPFFILLDLKEALVFKGLIKGMEEPFNLVLAVLSIVCGAWTLYIYVMAMSHLQKFSVTKTLAYTLVSGVMYGVAVFFIAYTILFILFNFLGFS